MDLRDRVVVVTGASSGVDRALALELAWLVRLQLRASVADRALATEGR